MAAEALAVVPALTPARVRKRSMRRYLLPMLLITVLLGSTGAAGRPPAARAGNAEAALPAGPSTAPRYTITDLGALGGGITKGMGVNEHGQVVGSSQLGNYFYAFLWDDGSMTNLGALAGLGSWAHDINNAGQVVGVSQLSNFNSHAFRWQNGAMQDLGTLGGPLSYAFDINNSGQTAGSAERADDGIHHAVLWGSGGIVDLGDLGNLWDTDSAAYGINDAGQVVGGSYNDAGEFHAFRWQNGGMQDLGTLGGDTGTAMAINEAGQVVGASRPAGSIPVHAFLWDGGMQDLGALGWNQSIAFDINEKEQVVGALQSGQSSHAFVWANGQMQDLNGLIPANSGWVLSEAHAINDKGQITGFGTVNGQTRAFLLKPNAYHWINPAGGAWHLTTNWDPQGDPGEGDVVIFDLNGQYTVNASALDASPATFLVDRMVISSTATVNFNNLNLNLVSDSPEEPSLQVNDNGIANVNSGTATFSHAIVGGLTPLNPANPPIARLQVFNNGTGLNGTGRLTIGDDGPGELFVANGGHLTSTEARLGGLLPNTTGAAVVGGNGSLWETGNIAVGYGVSGTLTVENGGRVDSNDAYVSFGVLSADSAVTVEGSGPGAGQASMWALNGSLTVGQSWFGSVEMLNGGDLFVSQDATIKNGSIRVDGRHANGDPSELNVLGNLFIGGPGNPNLLAFWREAEGNIEGNLHIGKDGPGALGLWGQGQLANATKLEVDDLAGWPVPDWPGVQRRAFYGRGRPSALPGHSAWAGRHVRQRFSFRGWRHGARAGRAAGGECGGRQRPGDDDEQRAGGHRGDLHRAQRGDQRQRDVGGGHPGPAQRRHAVSRHHRRISAGLRSLHRPGRAGSRRDGYVGPYRPADHRSHRPAADPAGRPRRGPIRQPERHRPGDAGRRADAGFPERLRALSQRHLHPAHGHRRPHRRLRQRGDQRPAARPRLSIDHRQRTGAVQVAGRAAEKDFPAAGAPPALNAQQARLLRRPALDTGPSFSATRGGGVSGGLPRIHRTARTSPGG
jgi:probable HAF family extracellular repeat protein/T5SS/PEP-CTERM-associated repeat protein